MAASNNNYNEASNSTPVTYSLPTNLDLVDKTSNKGSINMTFSLNVEERFLKQKYYQSNDTQPFIN